VASDGTATLGNQRLDAIVDDEYRLAFDDRRRSRIDRPIG
jgi:hypothetical protein